MRGKAFPTVPFLFFLGITPAYAGKRSKESLSCSGSRDHPRLCGEKTDLNILTLSKLGSPPPMRGKAPAGCCPACTGRITPAYAGKRRTGGAVQRDRWDHPRLCGEKANLFGVTTDYLGSPPPMRGKGSIESIIERRIRITPAYAGKSCSNRRTGGGIWDHPRLCGEKAKETKEFSGELGSPPPMRGKVLRCEWACPRKRDHPRLCGEKRGTGRLKLNHEGSPPPMRGKATVIIP